MFIGLTKLYIGETLRGDISHIRHEGDTYFFEMWDTDKVYQTNKLGKLDVLLGAGDKIVIPE